MNTELLKDYAEWIIREHAFDIEFMSVFEMEDSFRYSHGGAFDGPGGEITEEEARYVDGLLNKATVSITWENL